jgi:hypothetical protein
MVTPRRGVDSRRRFSAYQVAAELSRQKRRLRIVSAGMAVLIRQPLGNKADE